MAILSKILTRTDVETRLWMPASSLRYFPSFEEGENAQVLKVEDEEGNEWFFTLIIRRGMYRKPVISAGWRQFVKSKQLKSGFMVELVEEEDHEGTGEVKYKIKLKKPVVLFNSVLGYAPYRAG